MADSFRVIRVVMNSPAAKALLQSEPIAAELKRRADLIADAAGGAPDYEVRVSRGSARARATIITATIKGRAGEAKDRRLSNALNAGRG